MQPMAQIDRQLHVHHWEWIAYIVSGRSQPQAGTYTGWRTAAAHRLQPGLEAAGHGFGVQAAAAALLLGLAGLSKAVWSTLCCNRKG